MWCIVSPLPLFPFSMSNTGVKAENGESVSYSSSSGLPGSMYSISKLDGGNWSSWSMRVTAVLVERELDQVVDGTLVRTESNKEVWDKKNNAAKAMIILNVSEEQLTHIRTADTAKEIMDKLKKIHQVKGLASRLYLKKKLLSTKYIEGTSMSTHIVGLKKLVQQLEDMGHGVEDEELALMILISLPDSYSPLIMSLETMASSLGKLSSDVVIERLLSEDSRREELKKDSETALFTNVVSNTNKAIRLILITIIVIFLAMLVVKSVISNIIVRKEVTIIIIIVVVLEVEVVAVMVEEAILTVMILLMP
ncbi:MAG TPA: hypothetical protein VHA52_09780 [Candidatus Babeliaceae bacterium]|nr:hypothetical protein [Candidatus Babeliaceae bacterium]